MKRMSFTSRALAITLLACCFVVTSGRTLSAQTMPSPAPTPSPAANAASPSQPTAAGGSLSVESEAIAYEALSQLSHQVNNEIGSTCQKQNVLLATPANLTDISSYIAFKTAVAGLTKAYQDYKSSVSSPENVFHADDAVSTISGLASALVALKASSTQASSTFTQVDQALISDLQRDLRVSSCNLVASPSPGKIATVFEVLDAPMQALYKARQDAFAAAAAAKSSKAKATKDDDKDPRLTSLDAQLATLEKSLTDTSGSSVLPNVLAGAALLAALQPNGNNDKYDVLTLVTDAIGGGSLANQYFLVNLLFPSPRPSYNGGAVISYTLTNQDGGVLAANTLRFVFNYTKLHGPKLGDNKGKSSGFASFESTDLSRPKAAGFQATH